VAEHDLDEIAWAVARDTGSPVIAEQLIDSIVTRFYLLADHPKFGRARDDLPTGARSFPVGNYVIVYLVDGEGMQILRIVRGRRDIAALFGR
jgi:toxin ParE1/3/4